MDVVNEEDQIFNDIDALNAAINEDDIESSDFDDIDSDTSQEINTLSDVETEKHEEPTFATLTTFNENNWENNQIITNDEYLNPFSQPG